MQNMNMMGGIPGTSAGNMYSQGNPQMSYLPSNQGQPNQYASYQINKETRNPNEIEGQYTQQNYSLESGGGNKMMSDAYVISQSQMGQLQNQPNFNYIPNGSSNPMSISQMNPTQLQIDQQNLRANYGGGINYMQQQQQPQQRPYDNMNPNAVVQSTDNRNMNQFMPTLTSMLTNPGGQMQPIYGGMLSNPSNNSLMQNTALHNLPTVSSKIMPKGTTVDSNNLTVFRVPPNATNSIYIDGVPFDSTEREVAHIFRPFPGFKEVRLISKEKNGRKFYFCFVDFENPQQSTIALTTLQGYRFDKQDKTGLKISFARDSRDSGAKDFKRKMVKKT